MALLITRHIAVVVCGVILLAGCSTTSLKLNSASIPQAQLDDLLTGEVFLGHQVAASELPDIDVLSSDKEMKSFLERYVLPYKYKQDRVHHLLHALFSPGVHGMRYQAEETKTAREAFHTRSGNCLAFTNMFIALAREAGLKAHYQNVLVAPEWAKSDNSIMLRRHVNVVVDLNRFKRRTIDFNSSVGGKVVAEGDVIDDNEAFAQYFNNIAIEYLHAKDYPQTFLYLRKALATDPKSAFTWSNLGVLYRRVDELKRAETALLYALELNPKEQVAMSNLARVSLDLGKTEESKYYSALVKKFRLKNPYYLLALAQRELKAGKYQGALDYLARAKSIKPTESALYKLQAEIYTLQGRTQLATRSEQKAVEYSAEQWRQRPSP
ncbi:MAG: transglutaminase domain-containing protein [Pseudomonadales bacterium]